MPEPKSKILTEEDAVIIAQCKIERKKYKQYIKEFSDASLAKKFNVSRRTIGRIQV